MKPTAKDLKPGTTLIVVVPCRTPNCMKCSGYKLPPRQIAEVNDTGHDHAREYVLDDGEIVTISLFDHFRWGREDAIVWERSSLSGWGS